MSSDNHLGLGGFPRFPLILSWDLCLKKDWMSWIFQREIITELLLSLPPTENSGTGLWKTFFRSSLSESQHCSMSNITTELYGYKPADEQHRYTMISSLIPALLDCLLFVVKYSGYIWHPLNLHRPRCVSTVLITQQGSLSYTSLWLGCKSQTPQVEDYHKFPQNGKWNTSEVWSVIECPFWVSGHTFWEEGEDNAQGRISFQKCFGWLESKHLIQCYLWLCFCSFSLHAHPTHFVCCSTDRTLSMQLAHCKNHTDEKCQESRLVWVSLLYPWSIRMLVKLLGI